MGGRALENRHHPPHLHLAQHAFDRIAAGQPMPGVFEVQSVAPVSWTIDDLLLVAECSHQGEWEGQVRFLPSSGSS